MIKEILRLYKAEDLDIIYTQRIILYVDKREALQNFRYKKILGSFTNVYNSICIRFDVLLFLYKLLRVTRRIRIVIINILLLLWVLYNHLL